MKCPKCEYLGFETGTRCRNCGYDFTLLATGPDEAADGMAPDLDLRPAGTRDIPPTDWPLRDAADLPPVRSARHVEAPAPAARVEPVAPRLPLFARGSHADSDEPLIKLPVTPRPPLAVRRTPDTPRLRMVARAREAPPPEPALLFEDGPVDRRVPGAPRAEPDPTPASAASAGAPADPVPQAPVPRQPGTARSRVAAAGIDYLLLAGVDLAVVYFTLRVAGLGMHEWTVLPFVPLLAFLMLVKIGYFATFTAVGGQTIGKMALHIRVVTEELAQPDPLVALHRTLVGAASGALCGFGFIPALFDPERRAFHDRMTRTRVVALHAA